MRKMLLLCCFLITLKVLPAQTGKFSLAVGVGANQPVGAFGAKNTNQLNAGFAKTGVLANITATYMLSKTFGITALLGGQDNGVDTKTMEDAAIKQSQNPAGTQASITSRHLQAAKLLAGGTIALPLEATGKWLFTARVLGGVFKTRLPQQSGALYSTGTDLNNSFHVSAKRSKLPLPYTFAAICGAGVQYNVSKKVFWLGNINYNYAAPKAIAPNFISFSSVVWGTTTGTVVLPDGNPYAHRQPMCSIGFTVGAGVKL